MRVALVRELGGVDRVELGELPDPAPAAGQVLVRVHGAGAGPWDVGLVSGGFPGLTLPFVPGQEIAGVVEAAGNGAGFLVGEQVYGVLFPAGGGFAELAVAPADRLAPMPGGVSFPEAAGLVIGAGTAYEGLADRGHLQPGETVLVNGATGGAAVHLLRSVTGTTDPRQPQVPALTGRRARRFHAVRPRVRGRSRNLATSSIGGGAQVDEKTLSTNPISDGRDLASRGLSACQQGAGILLRVRARRGSRACWE